MPATVVVRLDMVCGEFFVVIRLMVLDLSVTLGRGEKKLLRLPETDVHKLCLLVPTAKARPERKFTHSSSSAEDNSGENWSCGSAAFSNMRSLLAVEYRQATPQSCQ